MSGTAHVSDLAVKLASGQRWALVRTHFGITAFGVNAYIGEEPDTELVGEHDEVGEGAPEHEELYFVGSGHATFSVDGDEIDAPAGTFVFVRDPAAKRSAVTREPGTTVVVVGAKPGEAFSPSGWERRSSALRFFASGEYEKAIEALKEILAESSEDARTLYNLACAESRVGSKDDALAHLEQAVALDAGFADLSTKDEDFDAIRDDSRFASAIAGETHVSGTGP